MNATLLASLGQGQSSLSNCTSLVWEVPCYIELIALLLWQKQIREILNNLRWSLRLFLLSFLVAMVVGQLIDRESRTYPVVAWSMFTAPVKGDPGYFEYTGTREDGSEVVLHANGLFPDTLGRNVIVRLSRLARSIAAAPGGTADPAEVARYERLLHAIAQKYNRTHSDRPIHTVRVWRCTVPLKNYQGVSSIRRKSFWHLHSLEANQHASRSWIP